MTEEYLHYLWNNKVIPLELLEFNSSYKIKHFGIYNANSAGPDFQHACIEIDGVSLHGSIEIHVKSSDWFKHKHQLDERYNNVILHVVYENDCEINVNGLLLPCLELKNRIDISHFLDFERFKLKNKKIWCSHQIVFTNSIDWIFRIEKELCTRFTRRIIDCEKLFSHEMEESDLLFALGLKSIFTSANKHGAEDLIARYPFHLLKDFSAENKMNILRVASGLDHQEDAYLKMAYKPEINQLLLTRGQVPFSLWNYKGVRPPNFPCKRILDAFKWVEAFSTLKNKLRYELLSYRHLRVFFGEHWKVKTGVVDRFLINAYVPFLFYLSNTLQTSRFRDYALALLQEIPPESNSIIKKWLRTGVKITSAYESQYFLEVFNEFCSHKKCLSCDIGKELLR